MINTIVQDVPVKLIMQLRSVFPNHEDNPMLLAKITTKNGEVYYPVSMFDDPDGRTWIICFDPKANASYRVASAFAFCDAQICSNFDPARLRQVDPDWFEAFSNLEFDPWS